MDLPWREALVKAHDCLLQCAGPIFSNSNAAITAAFSEGVQLLRQVIQQEAGGDKHFLESKMSAVHEEVYGMPYRMTNAQS